jgi:hypothetical protein
MGQIGKKSTFLFKKPDMASAEIKRWRRITSLLIQFFWLKTRDEKTHQELCKRVLQRIPWKKQGFWLIDGAHIPIPKFKMLRMK